MKRIAWQEEEMVAMVDIYYRNKNGLINDLPNELKELSRKLNKRADILNIDHDFKFRNYNGMKLIFQNVRFVDTGGKEGISNTSKLVYNIVDLYRKHHDTFEKLLRKFNENYT